MMYAITIQDNASAATAAILPELGFNCFRLLLPAGGKMLDVLWSAPGFETGGERASGSGIPILFPFPGRIPGTTFEWNGRYYPLEPGDAFGNAIHGFCHTRPWRVLQHSGNRIQGEFHASLDDASLLHRWPSDFRISATYELSGSMLTMHYRAENIGDAPLPCGLGVHPYFRLPLGGASANECLVSLPISKRWELKQMLPTGRRLNVDDVESYWQGRRFETLQLDDVFAGLQFSDEICTATIRDPEAMTQIAISWDHVWRECVVYTPSNREAICIEPYTCCAGAAVLNPRGIDAGLMILPAGGAFETQATIEASAL